MELELVAVAIAGLITVALAPQKLGLWETMIGLILLALLLRHWNMRREGAGLGFAYAGTFSLACVVTFGIVLELICGKLELNAARFRLFGETVATGRDIAFFAVWLVLSLGTRFVSGGGKHDDEK